MGWQNIFLLLLSYFTASIASAKDVHLVPPNPPNPPNLYDASEEPSNKAWVRAVESLKEKDQVFLGKKVYHLGKELGHGSGARTFVDADSAVPAVIKFERNPTISQINPNLSLKVQYEVLKKLEDERIPVARALDLGPNGLTMRQVLSPGVTAHDFFQNEFSKLSAREKREVIESIDQLFYTLMKRHLFTSDLSLWNLMIDPATRKPTIIDPGPIAPDVDVSDLFRQEMHFSSYTGEPYYIFAALHPKEACGYGIKLLRPGK